MYIVSFGWQTYFLLVCVVMNSFLGNSYQEIDVNCAPSSGPPYFLSGGVYIRLLVRIKGASETFVLAVRCMIT